MKRISLSNTGKVTIFSKLTLTVKVVFPGHLCCCCPVFHTMARHSKLQKQVLSLFRQFLRAGQDKPGFLPRIRDEFRENSSIKKTDVMHIEYLYRRGQRQLDQLKDVNTKQLGTFSKPKVER